MGIKKNVIVVCGLVRDHIELARLEARFNIIFDNTFDWVEHTFVKDDIELHSKYNILQGIDSFVEKYSKENAGAVFSSCDHGVAIAAILAFKLGLPCCNPKQMLLTHHKYYQRLQLAQAVPYAVPHFMILDPQKPDLKEMKFPFFMKPVKSVLSSHAYKITSSEVFAKALKSPHPPVTFLKEFYKLVQLAAPNETSHNCCMTLCEELISGEQFTVDGFVTENEVTIVGIVDSIMYPGTMSFASFEYPSKLPQAVQEQVKEISIKAIQGLGLTNTTFNIEYFYNETNGDLKIIEVNPRFSGQFGDIFEKVDGTNTYDIAVGFACGEAPKFDSGNGKYKVAASFVMRVFEDKIVKSVPSEKAIQKIQDMFTDAKIFVLVEKDTKLSDYIQDSGSYRYCLVHLGASSFEQLYKDYETCKGILQFDLAPIVY